MKKRIFAIVMAVMVVSVMTVSAFASATTPTVDYDTSVKPIIDKILGQLSVTNIVSMIASFIGAGIAFVFLWWAIRKGIKVLMSAIRKGKVSS